MATNPIQVFWDDTLQRLRRCPAVASVDDIPFEKVVEIGRKQIDDYANMVPGCTDSIALVHPASDLFNGFLSGPGPRRARVTLADHREYLLEFSESIKFLRNAWDMRIVELREDSSK